VWIGRIYQYNNSNKRARGIRIIQYNKYALINGDGREDRQRVYVRVRARVLKETGKTTRTI